MTQRLKCKFRIARTLAYWKYISALESFKITSAIPSVLLLGETLQPFILTPVKAQYHRMKKFLKEHYYF